MSINTCTISGNLTRDAELRTTRGGTNILTFTVAVNDRRKDPQDGEWKDFPNYIDVSLFGTRAEKLSTMLSKGSKVCVFGKLRWSQWEKNGQKRSKVEVVADDIELMGVPKTQNRPQSQQEVSYPNYGNNGPYSASQQPTGYQSDLSEEPIPF